MTERQLREAENKVLHYSNLMLGALGHLGQMATDILGYEVVADICNGSEIEFRPVDSYGVADALVCISMEDIIAELNKN